MALENAELYPANPTGKRRTDAEVPPEVDRDQWDRPKIIVARSDGRGTWTVPTDQDGQPIREEEGFTRASTLGGALEDQHGLNTWERGMVVYGMSRRPDLVLLAQAIPGTEDKINHRRPLYKLAEQAKEAAEASSAANIGTAIHKLTEQADVGPLAVHLGRYQGTIDAYLTEMAGWRIVRSETFVVSDHFHAAGSFDRLITPEVPMALVDVDGEIVAVIMPGDLVVVDIKTSTTADYFGTKFFAQLAVYVTGQLYNPETGERTPLHQRTDFALILHIPQGGETATWHWMDMRTGMALAQLACVVLEVRKKRFLRTYMRPVQVQPYTAGLVAEDMPGRSHSVPAELPNRDPLASGHLAPAAELLAAVPEPSAERADAIDAELIADGQPPEGRFTAPAALVGRNLGVDLETLTSMARMTGRSVGEVAAQLSAELDQLGAERAAHGEALDHSGDPDTWVDNGGAVPGPEETAPLPAGWESAREQAEQGTADPDDRNTISDGPSLGARLQEAAQRRKGEDTVIRNIERCATVNEILAIAQRAIPAGWWTERIKAAATQRKLEIREANRARTG